MNSERHVNFFILLRMLTGDEQLTDGEAMLNGYRFADQPERFLAEIGYCPQFDAIIDHMTGREMLTLFCRLRGIPSHKVGPEAQKWIDYLGMPLFFILNDFDTINGDY